MFRFNRLRGATVKTLLNSQLYDDQSFYAAFACDLKFARHSIIIESPFITTRRLDQLAPMFESAIKCGVRVFINTRDPESHDETMQQQAVRGIASLQTHGVTVLYTGKHHRKLAIIDHEVLWEGSLNILSQNDSCEVMRRVVSFELSNQMIQFTGMTQWYNQGQL